MTPIRKFLNSFYYAFQGLITAYQIEFKIKLHFLATIVVIAFATSFNFNYHDTTYMAVDRAKMNRAVFDALKPGGHYIVADHSALPGTGVSVGKSLHRIEEIAVQREVEAAGFRLVAEGGFLRNPNDPRTAPVANPDQPNDEFVLKFVKP